MAYKAAIAAKILLRCCWGLTSIWRNLQTKGRGRGGEVLLSTVASCPPVCIAPACRCAARTYTVTHSMSQARRFWISAKEHFSQSSLCTPSSMENGLSQACAGASNRSTLDLEKRCRSTSPSLQSYRQRLGLQQQKVLQILQLLQQYSS